MKKLIIGVIIILASIVGCNTAKAQNVQREGKTFISQNTKGAKASKDIETTYTWQDKDGNNYPIYLHQYDKGEKQGQWGAYVVRKSKKTGKLYKYYFPNNEEIAAEIMKEMKL